MSLTVGFRLGSFEVLSPIGSGGMGEVYRARDAKLERDVALKVIPEAFARDTERLARFQREAKVLASLSHPNIATIYGLEDSGATHALVMELVEGPTLADRIQSGPISIAEASPIAKQICEALEYAHERGIIHRDLKPANVKVTSNDAVKVLDFGLAKAIEGDASSLDIANSPTISRMATQAGILLGTAAYMAPEQAKGKPVDRRADIWAFGCVLYEMLTGKQAFTGETVTDTLAAVLTKDPDWSQLPSHTPARVRVLLQRCLQKDAKQRLQAIGDARISLEEVLSGAPEPSSAAAPAPAPLWRRMFPWAVAAVLTVALVTTLWVSWRQRPIEGPVNQFVLLPPEKAAFGPNGGQPAISPDGRQIVFTATDARGMLLWLRPLGSLDVRPLTGTEDAQYPFWSPDSRSIAFFAHGKLLRMDLPGGPPQTIAEDVLFPLGGAWSRDGVIAFTPHVGGLYRVLASGGEGKPISQAGQVEVFPSFLPDGRHFLFSRSRGPTQGDEYVGSLDSTDAKLIQPGTQTAAYAPPGYLLFIRGGTLMEQPFDLGALSVSGDPSAIANGVENFSVSETGTLVYTRSATAINRLVWVDRAGKQISEAAPPGEYDHMQLSREGKRVAFDHTDSGDLSIWIRNLERGIQSRLTFQQSNVPQWSPDGSTLVFAWLGSGGIDLGERPANMSDSEKVLVKLSAPPIMFPSDWSSDGRYLVYYRTDTNSKIQLWVLPMFGDRKPFPFLHSEFDESQGQVSPDGKWIAYVSDEAGAPQICVTSFPTPSGIQQISSAGGIQPRWRRDGKELFYLALDDELMSVTVRTSGTFEADSPRALFETRLPVSALRQAYSVSPDGQRFLLAVPTETASPSMTLVQNWQGALKK